MSPKALFLGGTAALTAGVAWPIGATSEYLGFGVAHLSFVGMAVTASTLVFLGGLHASRTNSYLGLCLLAFASAVLPMAVFLLVMNLRIPPSLAQVQFAFLAMLLPSLGFAIAAACRPNMKA